MNSDSIKVTAIPAFNDNYIWCLSRGGLAILVDPGDATPAMSALTHLGLELNAVLITHHHPDHVGGLVELLGKHPDLPVYGPENHCQEINHRVRGGDQVRLLDIDFSVLAVPGHTLDHIAYFSGNATTRYMEDDRPMLFCGDTLFAGGCGRLFEGKPAQMLQSLSSLAELPAETLVYCAHEYTMSNLRFAVAAEPGNPELQARYARVAQLRAQNEQTVPSLLKEELATNPFLRTASPELRGTVMAKAEMPSGTDAEIFAALRAWKDGF